MAWRTTFFSAIERYAGPRYARWTYGILIGSIIVLIGIFFVVALVPPGLYRNRNYQLIESPAEKSDRLVIMNILNRFQIAEGTVPRDLGDDERIALRREHIADAISHLEGLTESTGFVHDVQLKLLALFRAWDEALVSRQSTDAIRQQFIKLGQEYPWLNTLAWLIVLNRL